MSYIVAKHFKITVMTYKTTLVKNLIYYYGMTEENAKNAVEESTVNYMLEKSPDAALWQMHQSLKEVVKEIFEEY